MYRHAACWVVVALVVSAWGGAPSPVRAEVLNQASVSTAGVSGNADSSDAALSPNGRSVAFDSRATNLDSRCTNTFVPPFGHIFVHDRRTGTTTCITVAPNGQPANAGSLNPAISADGRFVVFESDATNLFTCSTNPNVQALCFGIFLHDRVTGTTTLVNVAPDGHTPANDISQFPGISTDGRVVAFFAYDPGFRGGVNVAVGDTRGDGRLQVITGPGDTGGPHVRVMNVTPQGVTEDRSVMTDDPSSRRGAQPAGMNTGDADGASNQARVRPQTEIAVAAPPPAPKSGRLREHRPVLEPSQ